MSIFSLNWFKSKRQKQIQELQEELKLKRLQEELSKTQESPIPPVRESEKPYKKIKLVNKVLTIVLNDGSILSKVNATEEDFNDAREAKSEQQLFGIVATPEIVAERQKQEEQVIKMKAIQKGIEVLKNTNDFTVEDNVVYLKGINRSLPQLLVEEFIRIVDSHENCPNGDLQAALNEDEKYQSLKRFFMWCCLNPRAEVANELYRFLTENSFRITKQGFFVALRNVVTLRADNELVQFVSNSYNKIKAVWKKKPDDYHVVKSNDGTFRLVTKDELSKTKTVCCDMCDGDGRYWDEDEDAYVTCDQCDGKGELDVPKVEGTDMGNLTQLYLDLPNMAENRFTDDWTKTFDIRVGKVVNMPMEECNWSTQDCAAAGLHFTANEIHYVGCGDQSMLILINPMKVVGIGHFKGRCYEYLPIMTVPRDEATQILHDLDFDTLELDEDYAIRELEDLAEKAKAGFVAETSKHSFNLPHISTAEINNIVLKLDDMKKEISKRVVSLD